MPRDLSLLFEFNFALVFLSKTLNWSRARTLHCFLIFATFPWFTLSGKISVFVYNLAFFLIIDFIFTCPKIGGGQTYIVVLCKTTFEWTRLELICSLGCGIDNLKYRGNIGMPFASYVADWVWFSIKATWSSFELRICTVG